jgi:hypothetical protein
MGSVSDTAVIHIVIYMAYMFRILTWSCHGQACEQIIDVMVYCCYSYKYPQNIKRVTYVLQILIFNNIVSLNEHIQCAPKVLGLIVLKIEDTYLFFI